MRRRGMYEDVDETLRRNLFFKSIRDEAEKTLNSPKCDDGGAGNKVKITIKKRRGRPKSHE